MTDTPPSVLVRTAGVTAWSRPETTTYANEDQLQALLAADPSRIPGVGHDAAAVRELSTSAGSIDVCIVARNGSVTVVECKLAKNPEKRRMVIGQVIDYASALRADGVRAFRDRWAAKGGADLDDLLEPDAVETLEENFEHGRINLCLAVDQIDDDLRRLIEHLNVITADEIMVTALQLAYAKHGDTEILFPSTYGAEIAAAKMSTKASVDRWTWDAFVDALVDPADQEIADNLRVRLKATAASGTKDQLWFGLRPRGGVFFHIHGERYSAFQLWQNSAHQLLVFGNWRSWGSRRNDDRFAELAAVLNQDHLGGSKSVAAQSLDLDVFWAAAVACDRAINDLPSAS